jgi:hypothetical protein
MFSLTKYKNSIFTHKPPFIFKNGIFFFFVIMLLKIILLLFWGEGGTDNTSDGSSYPHS